MEQRLLTPEEAAKMLGVKLNTLYTWALRNELPSYKMSRCRRFDRDELAEWLKGKRVGAEAE